MNRRDCLGALVAAPLALTLPRSAGAAQYPDKSVRILVAYGAGGTGDLTCRIVAQALSELLGQSFFVDNRPGAGGVTAAQAALAASRDGYTLLQAASGSFTMSPSLLKHFPFNPLKDFTPVGLVGTFAYAFAVKADSPLRTVGDLVARAKANPGKVNIGTVIVGSAQYLAAEYFKSVAGIDVVTVPYKTSGDVIAAVRSGDVAMAVETLAPLAGQFRAGTLHAMAVTSRERFSEMPDVPTVFESGYPGYDVSSWNGIVAPAGMPADRIATLNAAIDKVLGQPDVKQRFADLGFVAAGGTPAAFGTLIHDEITRWSGVIERAHIEKQ